MLDFGGNEGEDAPNFGGWYRWCFGRNNTHRLA